MKTMNKAEMRQFAIATVVNGTAKIKAYAKFARIQATQVDTEKTLQTILKNGFKETDEVKLAVGDWVITNPDGEKYHNTNEYFTKKYQPAPELGEGWYKPKGDVELFFQIEEDLTLEANWGMQTILAGGYIRVSNLDDIYGVNREEFLHTYKECNPEGNFL